MQGAEIQPHPFAAMSTTKQNEAESIAIIQAGDNDGLARDSAGGAGAEGVARSLAEGSGGATGPLPASVFAARPAGAKHTRDRGSSEHDARACKDTIATRENHATEETCAVLEKNTSCSQRVVWEGAMKLDCKHVWGYISDYIDDSVDPAVRADIEQ